MATLNYVTANHLGTVVPFANASAGGDKVAPDPRGAILVRNADTTATTVTVVVPGSAYGQERPDYTVVVASGDTAAIGPLPYDLIGADGLVSVTYSKVTALTVAAVRI